MGTVREEPELHAPPGAGALAVARAASVPFDGLRVRVVPLDVFAPDVESVPTDGTLVLRNPAYWVTALSRRGLVKSEADGRRALDAWRVMADAWLAREAAGVHAAAAVEYGDLRLEPSRPLYGLWRAWGLASDARALDVAIRARERWYVGAGGRRRRFGNPDRPSSERRLRGAPWSAVRAILEDARYAGLFARFEWPTSARRYRVPKRER